MSSRGDAMDTDVVERGRKKQRPAKAPALLRGAYTSVVSLDRATRDACRDARPPVAPPALRRPGDDATYLDFLRRTFVAALELRLPIEGSLLELISLAANVGFQMQLKMCTLKLFSDDLGSCVHARSEYKAKTGKTKITDLAAGNILASADLSNLETHSFTPSRRRQLKPEEAPAGRAGTSPGRTAA